MEINNQALGLFSDTKVITVDTAASLPSDVTAVTLFQRYWLSDLDVMAMAYGDHWEYSQIPSRTWANILAIASTSLKSGMTCRASDLSLHTFIWDGSNWQSLNGAPIKVGSSRTQVTLSGATSTSAQAAYSVIVPAKLVGTGGRLIVKSKCSFTASTNSKEIWMRDSAAGVTLANAVSTSATIYGINGELSATFETTTSSARVLTQSANHPYAGNLATTLTIDTTIDRTIIVGCTIASTSESVVFYGYDLYAERRAA